MDIPYAEYTLYTLSTFLCISKIINNSRGKHKVNQW